MYVLRCLGCGREYPDDGLRLRCDDSHEPALLRTIFTRAFDPNPSREGMLRYSCWLPGRPPSRLSAPRTAIFQSRELNRALRAPNLWIAFNGYLPARGALLPTGTFKDLESVAVLGRFPSESRRLLAASAGNTAAALAFAASRAEIPVTIVLPQHALAKLQFAAPISRCVRIIALGGDASYDDAIAFAKDLALRDDRHAFEGGASNVARRDGIGTTLLRAAEQLGRMPDVFVQAIGSGSGAIAAHEAALRLRDAGFAQLLPRLCLVQNEPSAPVYESWKRGSATLIGYDETGAQRRERIARLAAPVLGMQAPPYAIRGGLYDALRESNGTVCVADNAAAAHAALLFARAEGAELEPAAAVALGGLAAALDDASIDREACIVLHLTGGGRLPHAVYRPEKIELAA